MATKRNSNHQITFMRITQQHIRKVFIVCNPLAISNLSRLISNSVTNVQNSVTNVTCVTIYIQSMGNFTHQWVKLPTIVRLFV